MRRSAVGCVRLDRQASRAHRISARVAADLERWSRLTEIMKRSQPAQHGTPVADAWAGCRIDQGPRPWRQEMIPKPPGSFRAVEHVTCQRMPGEAWLTLSTTCRQRLSPQRTRPFTQRSHATSPCDKISLSAGTDIRDAMLLRVAATDIRQLTELEPRRI
jgi:hypothetical protein